MCQKFILYGYLKSFLLFSSKIILLGFVCSKVFVLYTCEVSVEAWFLLWFLAVCDTIGDCLRLTYSDDPRHRRYVYPIYLNGRGDSKRTDGNFFCCSKKLQKVSGVV